MKAIKLSVVYAFTLFVLTQSCNRKPDAVLAPETLFDSEGQQVITSSFNDKTGNMSIFYGNDLALQTALENSKIHVSGEVFTLVTWKQKPMPGWYGSNLNGDLLSVETVEVKRNTQGREDFTYIFEAKHPDFRNPFVSTKQNRINFIVNQTASVFP